jgi:virginiamycin B lyase
MAENCRVQGVIRLALGLLILLAATIGVAKTVDVASDVSQIRALRLENSRAIARHDISGMRKAWSSDIHLICCGNEMFSGASALMASYQEEEFRNPAFVAYVRMPERISVSGDRTRAAEYGRWVGVFTRPHPVASGRYFASWKKERDGWKITSESYVTLSADERGVAILHPITLHVGGTPDWLAVTPSAVWVANDALEAVQRISPTGKKVEAAVSVPGEPCSGLTYAFGSVWAPICGAHPGLARIDPQRNAVTKFLPIPPALSEGGITASSDSVWLVTREGVLARIDPDRNRIRQSVAIAPGSFNPLYSGGVVWITGGTTNTVIAVDARSGEVIASVATGSKPRFLTAGGGMLWTLDQGDGSIGEIDMKRKKLVDLIPANIPGGGGDISYGAGAVWASIIGVPLTQLSVTCNELTQWLGRGGDAVRFGDGAIWLTDYHAGRIFRIQQNAAGAACKPGTHPRHID